MKKFLIVGAVVLIGLAAFSFLNRTSDKKTADKLPDQNLTNDDSGEMNAELDPLTIESLRQGEYPGSEITVEQTLPSGSNYDRYITSYRSEGLKIYALLTIPQGEKPAGGWPVIIFNHGYIPPAEYRTTERYIAYTDGFSRNGYILFRPDYRGHGNSEGEAAGGYGSNAYTIDVLNAAASMKKHKDADPKRIGFWGHSMGGFITLRSMVVDKDIKVGVVWAGVVASYPDLITRWRRRTPRPTIPGSRGSWRQRLIEIYGEPEENSEFWKSISANSYLKDLGGPIQLHHGTADTSVPVEFSEKLADQMKKAGKPVELFTYPGDDHNISLNFNSAMQRSIEYFDKKLK